MILFYSCPVVSVDFNTIEQKAKQLLPPAKEAGQSLQLICDLLCEQVPYYNWTGFYFAIPDKRILVLGPFCGEPTEHTQIPYGRGICGQSAESLETFVVPDVSVAQNYLSCSAKTKAEIVVPVFLNGRFVAEIDIDSHNREPFGPEDEPFLRRIAEHVAPHIPSVFDPTRF